MQIETLFKTDIYKTEVANHEQIKTFFTHSIEKEFKENGPNCNFCNVYSDFFPGARPIDWDDILPKYEETISKFLKFYGYDIDNNDWVIGVDAWYNVTGKGGWGEIHNHLSSPRTIQVCAVHYIKYDPKLHAPTIFYNPSADGIRSTQPTPIADKLPAKYPKEVMQIDVKEGDMIFFAPYLNHSIPIQQSEEPRITTAFNITITEK
jgi:uncharacterized protein (TIGR02466 family)